MLSFLYVVQLIVAIAVILIVMFQKTEGGTGLISSNTYNSFFANKALVSNPLTKFTIILGFVFFLNSIFIGAYHIAANKNKKSLLDQIQAVEKNQEEEAQAKKDVPLGNNE